jgi:hypothetical protein
MCPRFEPIVGRWPWPWLRIRPDGVRLELDLELPRCLEALEMSGPYVGKQAQTIPTPISTELHTDAYTES